MQEIFAQLQIGELCTKKNYANKERRVVLPEMIFGFLKSYIIKIITKWRVVRTIISCTVHTVKLFTYNTCYFDFDPESMFSPYIKSKFCDDIIFMILYIK